VGAPPRLFYPLFVVLCCPFAWWILCAEKQPENFLVLFGGNVLCKKIHNSKTVKNRQKIIKGIKC
jgi:hypothetical protein